MTEPSAGPGFVETTDMSQVDLGGDDEPMSEGEPEPEQAMMVATATARVGSADGSPPPPGSLSSTLQLYAQLKNTLDTGRIKTLDYKSRPYRVTGRVPDALAGVTLPGVSPMGTGIKTTMIAGELETKKVGLKDLACWYDEQNDSKKYSVHEWKQTGNYVQQTSRQRQRLSSAARQAAELKRNTVHTHLALKQAGTVQCITTRIETVDKLQARVKKAQDATLKQIEHMTRGINELVHYINTKFSWPRKCNYACLEFREGRIGIDRIVDKVEVGLGKEKVMLESMAAKELEPVLLESQQQLDELKQVYALLAEDRDRKRRARTVDQKTKDLNTKEIGDGFEQVVAKPDTAISVQAWEQQAVKLLERAKAGVDQSKRLRKAMKDTMAMCNDVVRQHQQTLARGFVKARARAAQACFTNDTIIAETRAEIIVVDAEIFKLFDVIAEQEVPLKYAATRLKERASRPDEERTLDLAHKALIEEVAELEAAVASLMDEVDTNSRNKQDLLNMVGMLEEDQTIKTQTLYLETRCITARSYLDEDTDPYFIQNLMTDDVFFDLNTK